jgi:diguanylate cyclase (GGDEF)-like protein/PAS domain S-box-containing protein
LKVVNWGRVDVEAALHESQRAFSTLISNLPGLAYRCRNDPDWTTEFVSDGALELTGYPSEAFTAHRVKYNDLIHPDDRKWLWADTQRALLARQPFQQIYRLLTASGEEKWVWEQGRGVYAADGGLEALEGLVLDITEHQQARAALKAQAQLLDLAHDAILVWDLETGAIRFWSRGAEELYGWTRDEVLGRSVQAVLQTEFPRPEAEINAELRDAARWEGELTQVRRDGSRVVLASRWALQTEDGQPIAVIGINRDITERQQVENRVRESEELYRQMFQKNYAIKLLIDPATGAIVDANAAAADFYGYSRADLLRANITRINTLTPQETAAEMAHAKREQRHYFLFRHRLASGEVRDVEVHSSPVDVGGQVLLYSIIHDITERRQAESTLRFQKSLLEAQGEASPDGMIAVTPQGEILSFNRRLAELWRLPEEALATRSGEPTLKAMLDQVADPQEFLARIAELWEQPEATSHDELPLKDGRTFDRHSAPVRAADGAYYGRVWFFRDITAHKQAEDALRHQALHDMLTELPNRALLHDRLEHALQAARRDSSALALLVMDLDNFKDVNDTFGHHCGDLLLQEVGRRLRGALRASDTFARLGGDEFAVVLPAANASVATHVAEQLVQALEHPFALEGHHLVVGASIGISVYPEHGSDADTLLRRADVAMYVAKRAGGGYALYAVEHDQNSPDRLALVGELRQAIEQEQLVLHFQPKVAVEGGLAGVEALVRWQHPRRGVVLPDEFIPLAEHTGLIKPLTRWVLDAALRQCRVWLDAGWTIPVAVNVSMADLHDENFPDMIAGLLAVRRVRADCLRVEITEGTIMVDPPRALSVLERLRALGVHTAIDDFGIGYSSLAYLKRLPVDELKIDRSFVRNLAADPRDRAIVRSTISLAHELGLRALAEGVEDQAAWDVLRNFGCDLVQGQFVSRPLPATEVVRWLGSSRLTQTAERPAA